MENVLEERPETAKIHNTLVLRVRYIASRKRLIDEHALKEETLAALKPRALLFFDLAEGNVDGGTKTYHFARDGNVLSNLSETLGSLAQGKHELKLDLIERFEQG